jgi:hypothetical protein
MVTGSKKNRKTDKTEESKTLRHSKLANMVKRNREPVTSVTLGNDNYRDIYLPLFQTFLIWLILIQITLGI